MPGSPAILLDSNAGAPLHPAVREALFAFLNSPEASGNPASLHAFGRGASGMIAEAERAILKTFRANAAEWTVTFTGSGTEANQLAVRSALHRARGKESPIVWAVSEIEHTSVLEIIPEMRRKGVEIRTLRPDASGDILGIAEIGNEAALLSAIGVGNETGILHGHLTSHILSGPLLHVDYVAGWGKAALDLSGPSAPDLVAIAGHKLGGLSGVGALVHRRSFHVDRPGTPNLAGIVAMRALAEHWPDVVGEIDRLRVLRDGFERELRNRFPRARITGEGLSRVPNVSHFHFSGLKRDLSLVGALDARGFAVSAGSACASRAPEPSHVLRAMGLSELDARNALRVSLHRGNTETEVGAFLEALTAIFRRYEAF